MIATEMTPRPTNEEEDKRLRVNVFIDAETLEVLQDKSRKLFGKTNVSGYIRWLCMQDAGTL